MEPTHPFPRHPNLCALHKAIGCQVGYIEELAMMDNASVSLLEDMLPGLRFSDRPSLSALAKDLFSNHIKTIDSAICEIYAFSWLKENGLLTEENIGYPLSWDSDDPPFEGFLPLAGLEVAFDVKDGSGSAYSTLTTALSKVLSKEAAALSISPPRIDVSFNAPHSQRWMNDNFKGIVNAFRESLREKGFGRRRDRISVDSGFVVVALDCSAGGSISSVGEKASFVASQVLTHAIDKDKKLQEFTSASHFMLIYVRRPHTGGADFDSRIMPEVINIVAGMPNLPLSLGGILFINYETSGNRSTPETILWDKEGILSGSLARSVDRNLTAEPYTSFIEAQAIARSLIPSDLTRTNAILAGACDLRGSNCTARGSIAAVHVFSHREETLLACDQCARLYRWPSS